MRAALPTPSIQVVRPVRACQVTQSPPQRIRRRAARRPVFEARDVAARLPLRARRRLTRSLPYGFAPRPLARTIGSFFVREYVVPVRERFVATAFQLSQHALRPASGHSRGGSASVSVARKAIKPCSQSRSMGASPTAAAMRAAKYISCHRPQLPYPAGCSSMRIRAHCSASALSPRRNASTARSAIEWLRKITSWPVHCQSTTAAACRSAACCSWPSHTARHASATCAIARNGNGPSLVTASAPVPHRSIGPAIPGHAV